jgi:hypothetical protein
VERGVGRGGEGKHWLYFEERFTLTKNYLPQTAMVTNDVFFEEK